MQNIIKINFDMSGLEIIQEQKEPPNDQSIKNIKLDPSLVDSKLLMNPQQQNEFQIFRSFHLEPESSTNNQSAIIAFILKWINHKYSQEFQEYSMRLVNLKVTNINDLSIQEMVKKVVKEKEGWKIEQKYEEKQVQNIIQKVREKYKKSIEKYEKVTYTSFDHKTDIKAEEEKEKQQLQIQNNKISEKTQQNKNQSVVIPKIDIKNRNIENQQASILKSQVQESQSNVSSLSPSVQLYSKYFTQPPLPTKAFLNELKTRRSSLNSSPPLPTSSNLSRVSYQKPATSNVKNIFRNPYLKMVFRQICKQNYRTDYTFDAISEGADLMNLNKWMVFCKEFDFIAKFSKKQVIDIYHLATQFGSKMNLEQFLHGVGLLQQKYIKKFHVLEDSFVDQVMQLSSLAAFQVKVSNFKVGYQGPRRDFFKEAMILPPDKRHEEEIDRKFKEQKKKHQLILIKGMYEDHIQTELNLLKQKRAEKKKNTEYQSQSAMGTSQTPNKPRMKFRSKQVTNYSKVFKEKQSLNNGTGGKTQNNYSSLNQQGKSTVKSTFKEEQKELLIQTPTKREWILPQNQSPSYAWQSEIKSESDESDDILKEHLKNQRQIININRLTDSIKLSNILKKKTEEKEQPNQAFITQQRSKTKTKEREREEDQSANYSNQRESRGKKRQWQKFY